MTRIFSGSDLEQYITGLVTPSFDAVLYRQVNLFANQRFPNNLTFVRNCSRPTAPRTPATRWPPSACCAITGITTPTFATATSSRSPAPTSWPAPLPWWRRTRPSPATRRWLGEAAAWQSHFERAAPLLVEAAQADTGDTDVVTRAAAVERSLRPPGDRRQADQRPGRPESC